jgi:predicted AlkP superfamily phosphohydrolase/phosphomutase
MPAKVVLVGFPGMETSLIDRWAADGTMPTFAELARKGKSLHVGNRQDHLPDVLWPEIFTGRLGATLGWYRLPEQLFAGETRPRPVRPEDVDLTAVWDHASGAGRLLASVDIPYAGSSPRINGLHVRGWGNHDKPFGMTSEPDPNVFPELVGQFGTYPIAHVHAEHTRCDDQDDTVESYRWLRRGLLEGAETKSRLFRHVLDQRDWDLFLCAFEEAHCGGHEFWHHLDETSPWHDPSAPDDVKSTMRDIYARLDDGLARLLEGAGDDATVLVVPSHGMQTAVGGWQLMDEVLVRLGYGSGNRGVGRVRSYLPAPLKSVIRTALRGRARSGLQRLAGSLPAPLESPETRAVALLNSPCGAIRLNVKGRDPFGAIDPGSEYDAACDELEHELGELREVRTGRPAVRKVTRAVMAYGERLHPNVPDLLVSFDGELAPILAVSSARVGTVSAALRTRLLPRSGDHTETSRLICTGPSVEPAPLAYEGDILDIAPTLLDLVDVPLPDQLDGKPLQLGARTARAQPLAEPSA